MQMDIRQQQLTRYTDSDDDVWEFDDYGPTMNRPLPLPEAEWGDEQRLRQFGFCPVTLRDEAYTGKPWCHADILVRGQREVERQEMKHIYEPTTEAPA